MCHVHQCSKSLEFSLKSYQNNGTEKRDHFPIELVLVGPKSSAPTIYKHNFYHMSSFISFCIGPEMEVYCANCLNYIGQCWMAFKNSWIVLELNCPTKIHVYFEFKIKRKWKENSLDRTTVRNTLYWNFYSNSYPLHIRLLCTLKQLI